MKKEIILSVIAVCSMVGVQMNAQTKTSFGVKLNAGVSNVRLSELAGNNKFNPSAALGGFARIDFNENFALQPELMFNYTESEIKWGGEKTKFKYAGVEIPVYAVGKMEVGTGRIFLGVGPHVGYGFSADSKMEQLPQGAPGENRIELDHWYMGGGVNAGYEFPFRLSVSATYQISYDLRNSAHASKVKNHTLGVGVGYRF